MSDSESRHYRTRVRLVAGPVIGPARRADAVDNRERIVRAARESLAHSDGSPESLNLRRVAQSAGVGQGTLYRHFPTREDLITEVYREEMGYLVEAVPELLETYDPVEALTRWLMQVVEYAQVKRGVIAAIQTSTWQALYATEHHRLDHALGRLLEQGRDRGMLRADVDATDVVILLGGLSRVTPVDWEHRAPLLVSIIIDGLKIG